MEAEDGDDHGDCDSGRHVGSGNGSSTDHSLDEAYCAAGGLGADDSDSDMDAQRSQVESAGVLARPLPGPRSQLEALAWTKADREALEVRGRFWTGVDCIQKIKKCMADGVIMRTDYSGMGTPEEALRHIELEFGADFHGHSGRCRCQRAGDILPHCRSLLKANNSTMAPACIHKDIMERMHPSTTRAILDMQANYMALAAHTELSGTMQKMQARLHFGKRFFLYAFQQAFHDVQQVNMCDIKADCVVHNMPCPVLPSRPTDFLGFLCAIAGISCFDFTNMGLQAGWFGQSALPFIQWLVERVMSTEDFVIMECVEQFTDDIVRSAVQGIFELVSLRISPTMFGDPISRPRKYMILSRISSVCWEPKIVETGHQAVFHALFKRELLIHGDDKLQAPIEDVQRMIENMAKQRHMSPSRQSGRPWSCWQVMSAAQKSSLQNHEEKLRDMGQEIDAPFVSNLAQTPSFAAPKGPEALPVLLRRSSLWSFRKRRLATPLEHMALQNHVVFTAQEDPWRCSFLQGIYNLSDAQIKAVAGNGMHMHAIGSALLFALLVLRKLSRHA